MTQPKPHHQPQAFDLIIVGGGMVGASLACALAKHALKIAVIEASPFASQQQPSFDARSLALSYVSRQIFSAMDLWQPMQALGVAAIRDIHISDRGHAGITRLHHRDHQVEALGYVVETRVVGKVLNDALQQQANIKLFCPAQFNTLSVDADHVRVKITHQDQQLELSAKLIVAADGGNSLVRQQSGVEIYKADYAQAAIIANVGMDRAHQGQAYERFTDSGPMALLPMVGSAESEHRYSLVWTVADDQRESIMGWDDATFVAQLQQRFGERAGKFVRVSQRYAYPLSIMQVQEHVRPRLAFIGNAAHTVHPVAGQGFNLGLRDVAVLAQVIVDAQQQDKDFGELEILKRYAEWRRRDHLQTTVATDSMVRVFSSDFLPMAGLRNLGLLVLDLVPPLKNILARHAMGFVGKLPRLARGLKL